jgi:hypothetical protein
MNLGLLLVFNHGLPLREQLLRLAESLKLILLRHLNQELCKVQSVQELLSRFQISYRLLMWKDNPGEMKKNIKKIDVRLYLVMVLLESDKEDDSRIIT